MPAWRNWVGYETCTPARLAQPADTAAIAAVLRQAAADGHAVRAVGSGRSFAPLVPTDGVLVSLDRCRGILAADAATGLVTMRAGTTLRRGGSSMHLCGACSAYRPLAKLPALCFLKRQANKEGSP